MGPTNYSMKLLAGAGLIFLLAEFPAGARVIPYAPLTDMQPVPAIQHRTNREFVLIESNELIAPIPMGGDYGARLARLVLYDSLGERDPRVVFPLTGGNAEIRGAAARLQPDGRLAIFVATLEGGSAAHHLSVDSGSTWKTLTIPGASMRSSDSYPDPGGPIVRSRRAQIRIGTAEMPFVFSANEQGLIYAVHRDGSARELARGGLVGSNREGSKFPVIGTLPPDPETRPGSDLRFSRVRSGQGQAFDFHETS